MPESTLHKLDVARALLDRAAELFLDRGDLLSAYVLAGTAEDVLEGLLGHAGRGDTAARPMMAQSTVDLWKALEPEDPPLKPGDIRSVMRSPFNWARHADRPDEPMESTHDWYDQALWALDRAVHNLLELTGETHPRAHDLAMRTVAHRD